MHRAVHTVPYLPFLVVGVNMMEIRIICGADLMLSRRIEMDGDVRTIRSDRVNRVNRSGWIEHRERVSRYPGCGTEAQKEFFNAYDFVLNTSW